MPATRPSNIDEVLAFLSPRLKEMLLRCAKADRREALPELGYLIEEYAVGRLRRAGEDATITPRIALEGLPETFPLDDVRNVRRMLRPVDEADGPQPHGELDE